MRDGVRSALVRECGGYQLMGSVTAMASGVAASFYLPCANSLPGGARDGLCGGVSLLVKRPRLRVSEYSGEKQRRGCQGGGSVRRQGCYVARISETEGPTVKQEETEVREDERTGAGGYKLKENLPLPEVVHLEMETVDDVERPKRIAFNYGFQAKFLRTGPSVPGNVAKLAFENFGREWRVIPILLFEWLSCSSTSDKPRP